MIVEKCSTKGIWGKCVNPNPAISINYHNCCQGKIGVLNWQQSQWADWWIWIDTLTECGLPVLQVGTSGQSTLREGPEGLGPPNLFLSQTEAPIVPYQQNSLMVREKNGRKERELCQPLTHSSMKLPTIFVVETDWFSNEFCLKWNAYPRGILWISSDGDVQTGAKIQPQKNP